MKILKRVELIGFSLVLLLSLLSVFVDYEGQSIIIGFLMSLGAFAYFFGGFFFFSKSPFLSYKPSVGFGVFMGITTSIVLVGLMFRSSLFDGAEVMLLTGSALTGACLLLATVLMVKAPEHKSYWRLTLIRLGTLLVIGLFMYTQNRDVVMQRKYGDYPFYLEAVDNFRADPSDENHEELIKAIHKLDSLRYAE